MRGGGMRLGLAVLAILFSAGTAFAQETRHSMGWGNEGDVRKARSAGTFEARKQQRRAKDSGAVTRETKARSRGSRRNVDRNSWLERPSFGSGHGQSGYTGGHGRSGWGEGAGGWRGWR